MASFCFHQTIQLCWVILLGPVPLYFRTPNILAKFPSRGNEDSLNIRAQSRTSKMSKRFTDGFSMIFRFKKTGAKLMA
jgi:hypothetical protein